MAINEDGSSNGTLVAATWQVMKSIFDLTCDTKFDLTLYDVFY